MLLTAENIGLNFFLDLAHCVKLSSSAVKSEAIDIHGIYAGVVTGFFLH